MHLRADLGAGRDRLDRRVGHVGGVWRGEADALDSGDSVGAAQELGEVDVSVAIGVDGLPEKNDFLEPLRGGVLDLLDHVLDGEASLAPAHVWNDAEGAELVAPAHDADPGADSVGTGGSEIGVGLIPTQTRGQGRLLARLIDEKGKVAVRVRAYNQIELRHALEETSLQVLGHAPRDAEDDSGAAMLVPAQLAQAPVDALLGMLADGTGVDEDHVGFGGLIDPLVARGAELTEHQLGVGHVHLAAVGLDVDPTRHGG